MLRSTNTILHRRVQLLIWKTVGCDHIKQLYIISFTWQHLCVKMYHGFHSLVPEIGCDLGDIILLSKTLFRFSSFHKHLYSRHSQPCSEPTQASKAEQTLPTVWLYSVQVGWKICRTVLLSG